MVAMHHGVMGTHRAATGQMPGSRSTETQGSCCTETIMMMLHRNATMAVHRHTVVRLLTNTTQTLVMHHFDFTCPALDRCTTLDAQTLELCHERKRVISHALAKQG